MEKYDLLPRQLIHEGTIEQRQFFAPESINNIHVEAVHSVDYLKRLRNLELTKKEQRTSGFIHNETLIKREWTIMEGTRMAAELAIKNNICFNIAGGTHHAFLDRGEGFCLLNDQVIAAHWLLTQKRVNKILILDLDVHQGNGTASLCTNQDNIFTFSMHGKNNYPLRKEQSDIDIELEDGIKDAKYLHQLKRGIEDVMNCFQPEFIFYQAGVDVLESDKLGRLNLSLEGCKERDTVVFDLSRQLDVPIVTTMGGGYSKEINTIVEAHANTYRCGYDIRS
jgi:acetoin utilization deacetylase AcuC-like enzyme